MIVVKKSGFSLIEILIVVVIMGTLAALVMPNIMKRFGKAQVQTTKVTLAGLKSALLEYNMDMGHFPDKREGGLEALVTKPDVKGNERWKGSYISEVPLDAWNNEFVYNKPPQQFKQYKHFEIYSLGNTPEDENNPELRTGE